MTSTPTNEQLIFCDAILESISGRTFMMESLMTYGSTKEKICIRVPVPLPLPLLFLGGNFKISNRLMLYEFILRDVRFAAHEVSKSENIKIFITSVVEGKKECFIKWRTQHIYGYIVSDIWLLLGNMISLLCLFANRIIIS